MQVNTSIQQTSIYIRFYNKKGHILQIPVAATLYQIVNIISAKSQINKTDLILILKGKIIFDSSRPQTIASSINLQNKNIIHVVDKRQLANLDTISLNIQFIIKNQPESIHKKLNIKLKTNSTVKQLLNSIQKQSPEVNYQDVTLLSAGRVLDSSKSISEFYIQNQGQIMCFVNQQEKIKQNTTQKQEDKVLIKNVSISEEYTSTKYNQTSTPTFQSAVRNKQIIHAQLENSQQNTQPVNNSKHQSQKFVKLQKFPSLNVVIPQQVPAYQNYQANNKHKLQKKDKIQSLLAAQFQNEFYQPKMELKTTSDYYADEPVSPIQVYYPQYQRVNHLKAGDYLMIKGIADQSSKHSLSEYIHDFSLGNLDNIFIKKQNDNEINSEVKTSLVPETIEQIRQHQLQ